LGVGLLLALVLLLPGPAEAMAVPTQDEGALGPQGTALQAGGQAPDAAPAAPPTIDVWYNSPQPFGQIGVPQTWVNVLGNVSDQDGIRSLTYSLNGGAEQPLTVGPNGTRLADPGDFNVEIAYTDLRSGWNDVVLTATDNQGNRTVKTVTVDYDSGNTWPNPYYIDWSTVDEIQDVAQVVDGKWVKSGGQVRPVGASARSYDRLIGFGNTNWRDYEVTVPVTIQAMYGLDPGVGILLRWQGHLEDDEQPSGRVRWGGLGWYRVEPGEGEPWLSIITGRRTLIAVDQTRRLSMNVPYIFKVRVRTESGGLSRYSLKVWEAGDPEPVDWDLSGIGDTPGYERGSALLVAHRADASFGHVTTTPLQSGYDLALGTVGQGAVGRDPDKTSYDYGEVVTLTPTPDAGWSTNGWTGTDAADLVDNGDGTWSLAMVKDRTLTARFLHPDLDVTLTANTVGQGTVNDTPGNPYLAGETATLESVPNAGWSLAGWSGPDAGQLQDNGDGTWSLAMDADKAVTATFTLDDYALAVGTEGSGTVAKSPDQATYQYGDRVTLTPQAASGWIFSYWGGPNGGDVGYIGSGRWSIVMDGDKSVIAHFVRDEQTLTINTVGQGTVQKNPDKAIYRSGDVVTLTPVPDTGWGFAGWSGPNAGELQDNGDGTWRLTMDGDKELTATFSQSAYLLTINTVGSGAVARNPDQPAYDYGVVVRLTPAPYVGWTFAGWSGPNAGELVYNHDGSWSLTMDGYKQLTATFTQDTYEVTITVQGQGAVDNSPGNPYGYGQMATLTPNPTAGWSFSEWTGPDGGDLVNNWDGTWSLWMNANKTVAATFTRDQYTVDVTIDGDGTVGNIPGNPYLYGETATLEPVADPGWTFGGWNGPDAGELQDNGDGTWSLIMDGGKQVTAMFTQDEYVVQVTIEGLGAVRHVPGNPYLYLEVATLEPIPAEDRLFAGWVGPDAGDLRENLDGTWSLRMDGDKAVTAVFAGSKVFLPLVLRHH
jgi:hypothetical protein